MMSPPRPPSPPSGPPIGTLCSRRNDVHPDPPVPASTLTTTRSTNISVSLVRRVPPCKHVGKEPTISNDVVIVDEIADAVEHRRHRVGRRARIERAVQMRVKLALLTARGTGRHDAELARFEVERRTRQHLA